MELFGRSVIYSDVDAVTDENVVKVLDKARNAHIVNRSQIQFLYDYYRGKQPILGRIKSVRPEICNRIVENRANEIVAFKVGYLCGEPVQYVSRKSDDGVSTAVADLNDMMLSESKATKDKELIEWQMICGTAFRMVLPDASGLIDDAPFEIYTLDPRNTFVIRSSRIGNHVLAAVHYVVDEFNNELYSVYTPTTYYEVKAREVIKRERHALKAIPIIEYPANNARLGAFETVIPILDAMNTVASNRIDGVEQFVQSLMKFINCDIDEETFAALQQMGAIKIKSVDGNNADVQIMTSELNQGQTQTLVDHMYQTVLTICGMPNRNGQNSSTSDTGAASLLRDGWTLAEARAKDSELMFKQSENEMLKLVLAICRGMSGMDLTLRDIDCKFTRRNYENIQTKSQVLISMLNNDKIDPRLAFSHCGMFTDSEEAYQISMKWYEEQKAEEERSLQEELDAERVRSVGQNDPASEQ